MPIYTNDPCDDGIFPVEPSLRSSIGIGPKITKAIDAATKDWLDKHPEATTTVEDDSITNAKLKDGSVNSRTIENESIITDDIADLAITTPKIADDAVTADKVASSAADGLRIMSTMQLGVAKVGAGLAMNDDALELNGGDIAPAVTAWLNAHPEATTTVQDNSITSRKIAAKSIGNRELKDGVIESIYNDINESTYHADYINFLTSELDITGSLEVDRCARKSLKITALTANSYVYIPVNIVDQYQTLLLTGTIGNDANIRLYDSEKSTLILSANITMGTRYNIGAPVGLCYLRLYLGTENTSIDITNIEFRSQYGDYDKVKPGIIRDAFIENAADVVVDMFENYDNGRIRIPIAWENHSLDVSGNVVSGAMRLCTDFMETDSDLSVASTDDISFWVYYYDSSFAFTEVSAYQYPGREPYVIETSKGDFFKILARNSTNTSMDLSEGDYVTLYKLASGGGGGASVNEVKYVTYRDVITNVERQIISTQVSTVDDPRNAANYNVLPSNSGTVNFDNLQAMLDDGGTIIVDVPGTYDIDGQLEIGSDTTLIFGAQVMMRKVNSVGGFLINKGATTKTYDQNIKIIGLNLVCNNTQGSTTTTVYGLRGEIGLFYVKDVVIKDFTCLDLPDQISFGIHISNWERVLIDNAWIVGDKDGIHVSRGKHLTIRRCKFSTKDDPIALNAYDYYISQPEVGWIEDVLIEDCIDYNDGRTTQRTILVLGGAWDDWASGNQYRSGDTVVASNGYVYRFAGPNFSKTLYTSTVEPTHTSGWQTLSDDCSWYCCQHDTIYNACVKNVTVRNFFFGKGRTNAVMFANEDSIYMRCVYPSAGIVPHSNFTFDSVQFSEDVVIHNFAEIQIPVDMLRVVNSRMKADNLVVTAKQWTTVNDNNKISLVVANNQLELNDNVTSMGLVSAASGLDFKVNAYGNLKRGGFAMSNSGTVTMALNDLTD